MVEAEPSPKLCEPVFGCTGGAAAFLGVAVAVVLSSSLSLLFFRFFGVVVAGSFAVGRVLNVVLSFLPTDRSVNRAAPGVSPGRPALDFHHGAIDSSREALGMNHATAPFSFPDSQTRLI